MTKTGISELELRTMQGVWIAPVAVRGLDGEIDKLVIPPGTYDNVRYKFWHLPAKVVTPFTSKRRLRDGDSLDLTLRTTVGPDYEVVNQVTLACIANPVLDPVLDPVRRTSQARIQRKHFNQAIFVKAHDAQVQFAHVELDPFEITITYSEIADSNIDYDGFALWIKTEDCYPPGDLANWEPFMIVNSPGANPYSYEVMIYNKRGQVAVTEMGKFPVVVVPGALPRKAPFRIAEARCPHDDDGDGNCHICVGVVTGCIMHPSPITPPPKSKKFDFTAINFS